MAATIDIFKGSDAATSYFAVYTAVIFNGSIVTRGKDTVTLGIVADPETGFEPTSDQAAMKIVLKGKGVVYNADGAVTAGTVTSVEFVNKLGLVAKLTGYPMDAAELYDAFEKALDFDLAAIFDILYNRVPYVVNGSAFGDVFGAAARGDAFFGNGGDDTLSGALGDDTIRGGADNDLLRGGADNDVLFGDAGRDFLDGEDGDDSINGGAGDDVIAPSAGKDTVNGGDGQDLISLLDLESSDGPCVVDLGKGTLTQGSLSYRFASIEGVVGATGTSGDRFVGGATDDAFLPGGFNVEIDGKGGHDRLIFYSHPDQFGGSTRDSAVTIDAVRGTVSNSILTDNVRFKNIESFAGSHSGDSIIGSGRDEEFLPMQGFDTIDGGGGDDTLSYALEQVVPFSGTTRQGAVVDLARNQATDTGGSPDKISGIENVVGSTLGDSLKGNAVANLLSGLDGKDTLAGQDGNDTLDGGAGADVMTGGKGNDVYFVDRGDRISEAKRGGTDTVNASVSHTLGAQFEKLNLIGAGAIDGTGNSLANVIVGNDKANDLDGGLGLDTLEGGKGRDAFVFSTAIGRKNVDVIDDFSVKDDVIRLDADIFVGIGKGVLAKGAFFAGRAAADEDHRIVYDARSGALLYDRDGSETKFAAVRFATLDEGLRITNADFVIFF